MTPTEFWGKAKRQSKNNGVLPTLIAEKFHSEIMERIKHGVGQGILSTSSIRANMAGTVLANEVMTYLLQPLGWIGREPVFAPRYHINT